MKLLKWLDEHLEEALMVILLVVISIVMLVQVVIRKIPSIPSLKWAEEFCRFCWVWSVFLSLPYTIRRGSMLRVSVLLDMMPKKLMAVVNLAVDAITILCMSLLAFHSVEVVSDIKASAETSPAMMWPMWIVYSIMLVGFVLAVIRGVQQMIDHVKHFSDHIMTAGEQAMIEAEEETKLVNGGEE